MKNVTPLPRLIGVVVQIGPFDTDLTGKTVRVFAVNDSDSTDKTEVSDSLGIPGQAVDAVYSPVCDLSGLSLRTDYRLVSYTDTVGGMRTTLLPNPDTPRPFLFNLFDPDGN